MGSSFNSMLFPTSRHQGLCSSTFSLATGLIVYIPGPVYGSKATGKRRVQTCIQWSGSWVRDIAIPVYDKWGDAMIVRDTFHFSNYSPGTKAAYEKSEIEVD